MDQAQQSIIVLKAEIYDLRQNISVLERDFNAFATRVAKASGFELDAETRVDDVLSHLENTFAGLEAKSEKAAAPKTKRKGKD